MTFFPVEWHFPFQFLAKCLLVSEQLTQMLILGQQTVQWSMEFIKHQAIKWEEKILLQCEITWNSNGHIFWKSIFIIDNPSFKQHVWYANSKVFDNYFFDRKVRGHSLNLYLYECKDILNRNSVCCNLLVKEKIRQFLKDYFRFYQRIFFK